MHATGINTGESNQHWCAFVLNNAVVGCCKNIKITKVSMYPRSVSAVGVRGVLGVPLSPATLLFNHHEDIYMPQLHIKI